jgi:plastocyanin
VAFILLILEENEEMKSLLIVCALALTGLVVYNSAQDKKHQGHHHTAPVAAAEEPEYDALALKDVAVGIKDFKFGPKALRIKAGTKVTWTNNEAVPHTVTADKGEFESGAISNGQSFSHTFDKAGTYRYHCNFHGSSMSGTVKVTK